MNASENLFNCQLQCAFILVFLIVLLIAGITEIMLREVSYEVQDYNVILS